MEAIKKAAEGMGQAELSYGPKIVAAREADIKAMRDQSAAMDALAQKGQLYNRWVNWEGNQTAEQYLAYLQREDQYLRLLNIQKQRGFYSPYQDYAFRNQEIAQQYLLARAEQQGYATPDQYLTYLANLRHAMELENQAWRDRVNALAAATSASVNYANAVGGSHLSAQQLMEGTTAASAALSALNSQEANPTAGLNSTLFMQQIAADQSALRALGASMATPDVQLTDDQMRGAVLLDQRLLAQLSQEVARPSVEMDAGPALTGIAAIMAALSALDARRNALNITERIIPVRGPTVPLTGGTNTGSGPPVVTGGDTSGTAATVAAAAATAKAEQDVANAEKAVSMQAGPMGVALDQMAAKWATQAVATAGAGAGWGALNVKIAAFGGLMGGIAVWHLALDGIIEALAILIPAVVTMVAGLGIWGAAAYSTGKAVYQQMSNVLTVSSALNQTVPPLTGTFQKLQNAVRPQVFELFGEGLLAMQKNTGTFQQLALKTGDVLDRFGARILLDFQQGGQGLQTFFSVGEKALTGLGQIIANFSHLFTGLIAATTHTHIAEDLLAILVAASKVVGVVGDLIHTPVGSWVAALTLGLHGLWLWGGLAATGLQQVGLQVAAIGKNIPGAEGAMAGFARTIGATNDQLAGMGFKSKGLDQIAQGIIHGDGAMINFARDTGVSDANLVKLVSRQPEIQRVADALGQSATQVAGIAIGMAKSGDSMDEFAAKMAGGKAKLAALKTAAQGVDSDIANIAVAAGAGAPAMEKLAGGVAQAAEDTPKAGLAMGILNGLVSVGTKYWPVLAAAAVAGIGLVVYHLLTAKDATQQWLDSLQQGLQGASSPTAGFNSLIQDLTETRAKVMAAQASLDGMTGSLGAQKTQFLTYNQAFSQTLTAYGIYTQAQIQAQGQVNELTKGLVQQEQEFNNVVQFLSKVSAAYGTDLVGALGLADLAGVRFSDMMQGPQTKAFQTAILQIAGLVAGYQAMGQQSGIVGQDMNALAVAAGGQLSSMQKLNQAWDTFTQLVSAPVTSFLAWDSAINTFRQDAQLAGAQMTGLGKNLALLGTSPAVTNAAIQLQQQFEAVFQSTQQMFDAFRSAQAVSGGAGDFISFVKASVAALIPLAGSNQAAAAQISALAQEAGGPATTNLKSLATWAGNIKDPMLAAYNATQQMTVATSNLSLDAQNLANSLASDMNALVKSSVEMAYITPLMNDLVKAIQQFGAGSQQAFDAQQNLYKGIAVVTGSTQEANTVVGLLTGTMTGNLYVTSKTSDAVATLQKVWANAHAPANQLATDLNNITQAAALYGTNSPQYKLALQQAITDTTNLGVSTQNATQLINQAATQVVPRATAAFVDWAKNGLGFSQGGAELLQQQLQNQLGPAFNQMGNLTVPANKKAFIDWAQNGLGYSRQAAIELWQETITLQKEMGIVTTQTVPAAKSQFEEWANAGLNYTTGKADDLWSELVAKLGPQLDHLGNLSVPNVKNRFIDWAENSLHLTQDKAHDLWAELVTLQGQIDAMHGKSVPVNVILGANGKVHAIVNSSGTFAAVQGGGTMVMQGYGTGGLIYGTGGGIDARPGGFVSGTGGGPRQDNQVAYLSSGEYVINATSASRIGLHTLNELNSYASGGPVLTPGGIGAGLARADTWAGNSGAVFAAQMGDAFATAMNKAFQAAESAASIGSGAGGMLSFMLSKIGHPYSQTLGRFGPTYYDCSGLVYDAAHAAGIPLPISDAIASLEADWFAGYDGDSTLNRNQVQRGDLVFFVGASPDPSTYGPIGHVGMAISNSQMVSALGTAYGVTVSDIGSDFVIGVRLGAPAPTGIKASGGAQAYAQSQLAAYGWGPDQWPPLEQLWNRESGWNAYAVNPSSGAAGIPQNINGWAAYGPGDYVAQVNWGLRYIAGKYGSPAAAWAHEIAQGWYGAGGPVGMLDGGLVDGNGRQIATLSGMLMHMPSSAGDVRGAGMAAGGPWAWAMESGGIVPSGGLLGTGVAGGAFTGALGGMGMASLAAGGPVGAMQFLAPGGVLSAGGGKKGGPPRRSTTPPRKQTAAQLFAARVKSAALGQKYIDQAFSALMSADNSKRPKWQRAIFNDIRAVQGMEVHDWDELAFAAGFAPQRLTSQIGILSTQLRAYNSDLAHADGGLIGSYAAGGIGPGGHGPAVPLPPKHFAGPGGSGAAVGSGWLGLRRVMPERYDQLGHTIRVLQREMPGLQAAWNAAYGTGSGPRGGTGTVKGSGPGGNPTPGPGRLPGVTWIAPPVNLPAPYGFPYYPSGLYDFNTMADGGPVGMSGLLSQLSVMPGMAGGGYYDAAPVINSVGKMTGAVASRQSAAASAASSGAGMAAGGAVVTFGDINIHNPRPEPASQSITRSTQKASFMVGRALA